MSKVIVQVNFKLQMPPADYLQVANQMSQAVASADGLLWKVWMVNEDECTAGGVYLFADEASARACMTSPLITRLYHHPGIADVIIRDFHVFEEPTRRTHGPIRLTSFVPPEPLSISPSVPYFLWG
jgi:hypothetical protein